MLILFQYILNKFKKSWTRYVKIVLAVRTLFTAHNDMKLLTIPHVLAGTWNMNFPKELKPNVFDLWQPS